MKKTRLARPDVAAKLWNISRDALQKRGQAGKVHRVPDPDRPTAYLYEVPEGSGSVMASSAEAQQPAAPSFLKEDQAPSKERRFARPLPSDTKRFIVTSAQNATPVHHGFFNALKVAAKALSAELIVIPLRYKNPTSRWTGSQQNEEHWAPEVEPYLYNQRKKLNPNLVLVGDIKTQPTASSPLNGFESLTGAESAIIGHTKLQLKVVPVPAGKFPKILTTTGACTVPNFTDSKAGKLGAFHHSLGAAIVEVVGRKFFLRQLLGNDDGSFIDLDREYTADGVRKAPPALGLVMGDTHVRFIDPAVSDATFGKGGIIETVDPKVLVWHDVLDGYSANPHHAGDPFVNIAKASVNYGDVRREVEDTIQFIDRSTGDRKSVLVASNHDNFLARWIAKEDWKSDPINAGFYLETALAMVRSTRMTAGGSSYLDPFKFWVEKLSQNKNVRCLGTDESFMLAGIECGMHGHRGPNGARGNIKNLSRVGPKAVIAHSHTPGIQEGCYQAGTSTPLRLEYNTGPSSWLNTHVVVYATGKRSLITVIDGEWKL